MPKLVLVLTHSGDATSDYLTERLEQGGVDSVRYNTDTDLATTRFIYREGLPTISWRDRGISPDQVGAVVLRRPKPLKVVGPGDPFETRHAAREWAEVWEGFLAHLPENRWINHPGSNFKASHKIEQLSRAREFGLRVPDTVVTNEPDEARLFLERQATSAIIKPLASGYIERTDPRDDTIIYTREFAGEHHDLLEAIRTCPVLFQQRIEKMLDVRMIVLDQEVVAVGIEARDASGQQRLDIRRNNMRDVLYSLVDVPDSVSIPVRGLLNSYDLRFAALDFAIAADSSWFFFEINPNGQWAWLDLEAGTDIARHFVDVFRNEM